jgi:hypothetical protein
MFFINIATLRHSGAVPVFTCRSEDELISAMERLGIPENSQARILVSLRRETTYSISGISLSDEVAAEFGWPPK